MDIYSLDKCYHHNASICRQRLAAARAEKAKGEMDLAVSDLVFAAMYYGRAELAADIYRKDFRSDRLEDMAYSLYVLFLDIESEVSQ